MNSFRQISIVTLMFLLLSSSAVGALTFQVTKTTDEVGTCDPSDCALREAVLAANGSPGADVIEVPAGIYLLTIPGAGEESSLQGDLDIIGDLEIRGSQLGSTVIQSNVADRVISAQAPPGTPYSIRLSDLTITGGDASAGGGIFASALALTIERTSITGNTAQMLGGGIAFNIGSLTILDSTVSHNAVEAGGGGGVYFFCLPNAPCDVVVRNSTISGNSASLAGGIWNSGTTTLTIFDSTIADNDVENFASALYNEIDVPTVLIGRSVISGDCVWTNRYNSASEGGNLEGPGDTCRLDQASDQVSVADLGLGALADNGGPTWTHDLLPGSPAIDAAASDCGSFDQRGFPRPLDGDGDGVAACDAGAYELGTPTGLADIPALGVGGLLLLAFSLTAGALIFLRRA